MPSDGGRMISREVRVGPKRVGPDSPVFIIVEIGATHGGQVETALRLVDAAAKSGVDAVKLQTIWADESYVPDTPSHDVFKTLWLTLEELKRIKRACEDQGLVLFSTPGDPVGLDMVLQLGVPLLKISSGLMTNLPFVERCAATGLPLVISSGMSYLPEVERTVQTATGAGCEELMLMHCVSLYPAPPQTLNLAAMRTLAAAFPCPVGYSDHYDGITAAVAATALGARLLEKHFTLDRNQFGPDHSFSADPVQMRELVDAVRAAERMVGVAEKAPDPAERPGRELYRRCLVARRPIAAGEVITLEAVGLKRPRPGNQGLAPECLEQVVGRRAARDIAQHESLTAEMVDMIAVGSRA